MFANNTERIGGTYKKVLYVGYTDDTFTSRISREDHLGVLGPVIRAEVGDEVLVHFRNAADRDYSIHPHGVMYVKRDEGDGYSDGTIGMYRCIARIQ